MGKTHTVWLSKISWWAIYEIWLETPGCETNKAFVVTSQTQKPVGALCRSPPQQSLLYCEQTCPLVWSGLSGLGVRCHGWGVRFMCNELDMLCLRSRCRIWSRQPQEGRWESCVQQLPEYCHCSVCFFFLFKRRQYAKASLVCTTLQVTVITKTLYIVT